MIFPVKQGSNRRANHDDLHELFFRSKNSQFTTKTDLSSSIFCLAYKWWQLAQGLLVIRGSLTGQLLCGRAFAVGSWG